MREDFTIDQLIAERRTATAVCRSCGQKAWFDLDRTRRAFGGSMPLNRIVLRVACENCGAADCTASVSSPEDG